MSLRTYLQKVLHEGDLTVRLPGGEALRLGDGTGPPVVVRITSPLWVARIAAAPSLGVGEAYRTVGSSWSRAGSGTSPS